jgi:hypothetical protein
MSFPYESHNQLIVGINDCVSDTYNPTWTSSVDFNLVSLLYLKASTNSFVNNLLQYQIF